MAPMETLNVLVITFNCGRQYLEPESLARRLSSALPDSQRPDLVLLSLQEIAPIAYCFLGGSYLIPYFQRFHHAVRLAEKALGGGGKLVNIVTRNVGMTACMAFVLEEHKEKLQGIATGAIGVGVQEMGNKGAVGLKLGFAVSEGEVLELTFVAAHLAPMEEALQRRNKDFESIVRKLVFTRDEFSPASEESEPLLANQSDNTDQQLRGLYSPTSHLILAGDLNYRTSSTRPRGAAHLIFPKPDADRNDPQHPSSLLENDQLTRELKAGRTCHGLCEAPIDFPPTYKYSGTAQLRAEREDTMTSWDWAKHRWPAWCDRILYLDLPSWMRSENPGIGIEVQKYTALALLPTSDHRPVVAMMSIPWKAIPTPDESRSEGDKRTNPPFDIDPRWKEKRKVARRKEIIVGLLAYLVLTWEGRGILVALLVGGLLGWYFVGGVLV
ncbi:MAG: hypothetical protein L6R40_005297 [Gallowayella cf. fulva]|nr:MAG: hypothetical protein L6R40_005297 [Xanthomendoza cf. fulva]